MGECKIMSTSCCRLTINMCVFIINISEYKKYIIISVSIRAICAEVQVVLCCMEKNRADQLVHLIFVTTTYDLGIFYDRVDLSFPLTRNGENIELCQPLVVIWRSASVNSYQYIWVYQKYINISINQYQIDTLNTSIQSCRLYFAAWKKESQSAGWKNMTQNIDHKNEK